MEVFGAIRNFDTFPSCPMYADVETFVGTVEKQWWVAANEREREMAFFCPGSASAVKSGKGGKRS